MWYCDNCVCVLHYLEVCGDFLLPVVIIISGCLDVSVHYLTVHSASKAIYVCVCSGGTEARCDVQVH